MDIQLKDMFDKAVKAINDSTYVKITDGWMEGPISHHQLSTGAEKEDDYFMQWTHPLKLHRVALRTALGYRLTYGLADDVWNSEIGIKIEGEPELTEEVNKHYAEYMKSRDFFREMKIFTGSLYEQGEACLLLYFNEEVEPDYSNFQNPIYENAEILKVEAVNYMDYKILEWDDYGEPLMYEVAVHMGHRGMTHIRTHASRMLRETSYEIYTKSTGWGKLQMLYDSIIVHSGILKAAGEAAYRWGTGHPLILTKNILSDDEIAVIKSAIGTPTRRSWHILPSEYVESFEMKGQAGQMLNLKALSDIAIENIVIGSKVPRAVLLGESQVAAGAVEDRNFYGLLDELQTDLERFVRKYHQKDINIQKLFNGLPPYTIDWGIRHVLNEMDQMELDQRRFSNALALTTICSVNECRKIAGFPPLPGPEGELIMGVDQLMQQMQQMELQAAMFAAGGIGETDESNTMGEKERSTKNMANTNKDLEKNKTVQKNKLRENKKKVKDAIDLMREDMSMDDIADLYGISKSTLYKLYNEE